MRFILISIIIPVYNKEEYLDECLRSVSLQSYEEIEIIVINDGSVDSSEEIIQKWIEKDARIRYFKQSNKGVAHARNKAISLSKGEYLYFIDADDTITKEAIKTLFKEAFRTNSDITLSNYYKKRNRKVKKAQSLIKRNLSSTDIQNKQIKSDMFLSRGRPLASVCNKLYKLEFINKEKIRFSDNVLAEDRLFNLLCYVNYPSITVLNEYTYTYNLIDNSRSRTFSETFFVECTSLLHCFYDYLVQNNKQDEELINLTVSYELENVLNYYYNFTEQSIKELNKALVLINKDCLFNEKIKAASSQRTLSKLKLDRSTIVINKKLVFLYRFLPNSFTSIYYWCLKKSIHTKNLLNKTIE